MKIVLNKIVLLTVDCHNILECNLTGHDAKLREGTVTE